MDEELQESYRLGRRSWYAQLDTDYSRTAITKRNKLAEIAFIVVASLCFFEICDLKGVDALSERASLRCWHADC